MDVFAVDVLGRGSGWLGNFGGERSLVICWWRVGGFCERDLSILILGHFSVMARSGDLIMMSMLLIGLVGCCCF